MEGVGELAFEAFGSGRLDILRALGDGSLRYSDLAKRVAASEGELSRHLKRLVEAGLVAKDASGAFSLEPHARAALAFVPALDVLARHADFFRAHDPTALPRDFLMRLDELAGARLLTDPFEMFRGIQSIMGGVETFFEGQWIISKEVLGAEDLAMQAGLYDRVRERKAAARGVMLEREVHVIYDAFPGVERVFPVRVVPAAATSFAISDAGAFLQFQDRSGRVDFNYAFYGDDARFVRWCRDLFEHAWQGARPFTRRA